MKDELTLKVGNRLIQGWDSVRVTRGIERLPSDFDLSLMDYFPGSSDEQLVNKGESCQVMLGDDLVMTGYIDRRNPLISKSRHEVRVSGRGKCQDLVDCSAEWPNNVISQANALQIAQRLAAPYGINVTSDITDMATVPQFTINWGESSQEIIDRISRWAALLYFDTPDGNLLLTRVGTRKAASGIAQGENVEYVSFIDAIDERFSDYIGVSMSMTPVKEVSDAGYGAVTLARARDPEAAGMRYRNRIIIVESTMNSHGQAQNCIDWEMNRRYGRSKQLFVTVDSWRDSAGNLWEPNTLLPIDLPIFGINDEWWLLSEVSFIRDGNQGTTARMVLMPPAAFAVQPYQFYNQLLELNR